MFDPMWVMMLPEMRRSVAFRGFMVLSGLWVRRVPPWRRMEAGDILDDEIGSRNGECRF